MASAPSVRYPVRRSPFLARMLGLTWLAGFLALAWAWPMPDWRWGFGVPGLLLAGAAAVRFWIRTAQGELRWDGGAWQGPNDSPLFAGPMVRFDGQRWMLVQVRLAGPQGSQERRWLWLEAATDPPAWAALRHALFAKAHPGHAAADIMHE